MLSRGKRERTECGPRGEGDHKTGKTGETASTRCPLVSRCLETTRTKAMQTHSKRNFGSEGKLAPVRRAFIKLAAAGLGKLQVLASVSSMSTQRPITAGRSIPLWLRTPTSSVSRVACYPLPRPSQDRLLCVSLAGHPTAAQLLARHAEPPEYRHLEKQRQSPGNERAGLFCGALFGEQGKTGKPVKQEPDSALIVAPLRHSRFEPPDDVVRERRPGLYERQAPVSVCASRAPQGEREQDHSGKLDLRSSISIVPLFHVGTVRN